MRVVASFLIVVLCGGAGACPWCRPLVRKAVYTPRFAQTMGLVLLPLGILTAAGVGIGKAQRPVARRE